MFFEIRIEPKKLMNWDEVKKIIQEAFEKEGGLYEDGLQLLTID